MFYYLSQGKVGSVELIESKEHNSGTTMDLWTINISWKFSDGCREIWHFSPGNPGQSWCSNWNLPVPASQGPGFRIDEDLLVNLIFLRRIPLAVSCTRRRRKQYRPDLRDISKCYHFLFEDVFSHWKWIMLSVYCPSFHSQRNIIEYWVGPWPWGV